MATWIVHLRIAEILLGQIEHLDPAEFAIGNIAPDSGVPDEKWEKFEPPAEVLHFGASKTGSWQIADLDFYRRYLQNSTWPSDDIQRFSFLLGYFFHLLTDNLWNSKITKDTQTKFASDFEADPDFGWEVKRDWYGLDFIYLRAHPESLFQRVFLDCEYTRDYLDFLPVEGVEQRIAYIKEFYQRQDEKIQALLERPYIYLSETTMNTFVNEAAQRLYQIFEYLWIHKRDVPESSTMLGLTWEKESSA